MDAGVRRQAPDHLALAKMVGNPTYFFDTSFLLANVASLAGWNQDRLEAAIDPRLDTALSRADVHFSAENGFYVIFASPNVSAAHDKAMTICADILRHFYGDGKYSPEHAAKVCRLSSVQSLAENLGLALGPTGTAHGSTAVRASERAHSPVIEETIDGEDE